MVSYAVRPSSVGAEDEAFEVDGRSLTLALLLKNGDHLGAWPPWRLGPTSQSFRGVVQTIASDRAGGHRRRSGCLSASFRVSLAIAGEQSMGREASGTAPVSS